MFCRVHSKDSHNIIVLTKPVVPTVPMVRPFTRFIGSHYTQSKLYDKPTQTTGGPSPTFAFTRASKHWQDCGSNRYCLVQPIMVGCAMK